MGAKVSRVDNSTGEEDLEVEGPGTITVAGYWASFETAIHARDKSVETASYSEFLNSTVQGIASIEAYINQQAEQWNKDHPNDQLVDSALQKVSFDDKIDVWIPKMTNGLRLEKGYTNWQDFKILRSFRDNLAIHPKQSGYSISLSDLAKNIGLFRTGIAGLLVDIHILFKERIPSVIIRAKYAPEVEIVEIDLASD